MTRPWQRSNQTKSYGTGFAISGHRILTNAHVVRAAVDIRVRKYGSTVRYLAKTIVYAPDVDLALLEVVGEQEVEEFFGDNDDNQKLALEFANDLPDLGATVHVVG